MKSFAIHFIDICCCVDDVCNGVVGGLFMVWLLLCCYSTVEVIPTMTMNMRVFGIFTYIVVLTIFSLASAKKW